MLRRLTIIALMMLAFTTSIMAQITTSGINGKVPLRVMRLSVLQLPQPTSHLVPCIVPLLMFTEDLTFRVCVLADPIR